MTEFYATYFGLPETVTFRVNGRTVSATVSVEVEEDDIGPADTIDFGDDKQAEEEYLNKFKTGALFLGVIIVKVTRGNIEATDVLGGVDLRPNNMFNDEPFITDVRQVVVDHDMLNTAIEELKASLRDHWMREAAPEMFRALEFVRDCAALPAVGRAMAQLAIDKATGKHEEDK